MKYNLRLLTILLILAGWSVSACRQKETKGLKQEVSNDSIFNKAEKLIYTKPVASQQLLLDILSNGSLKDSLEWYKYYILYTKAYLIRYEFDSGIHALYRTKKFIQKNASSSQEGYRLKADTYNSLGYYYAINEQNDSAQKYYNLAIHFLKKTKEKEQLINASNNLADSYIKTGEYVKGALQYKKSLIFADSVHLPKTKYLNIYLGLGQTYMELRNFNQAHKYYERAFNYYDEMDINQKFIYFNSLGNMHYFQKKYPEALSCFQKGYQISSQYPEYVYAQNVFKINIGEIFLLTNKLDSAEAYIYPAFNNFIQYNNPSGLYHANSLRLELALREKDLNKAASILEKIKDDKQNDPSLTSIRNKYLQHYFEETGNYNKAFHYLKENTSLEDSVRNVRIKMQVLEMQMRYSNDTILINKNLFIQKQKDEMNDWEIRASLAIAICIIIALITLYIYLYQKKQRTLQNIQYRNNIAKLRLENIRNRVSPHFTFNILNRVLSNFQETDPIYKSLYNLIKIMRMNLLLVERTCIPLMEELDFVRTYLTLEKERFDNSFSFSIHIDPQVDTRKIILPSMIIQIPVENSIKHGLRNKTGEKLLKINIEKTENGTNIIIEDNGTGFNPTISNNNKESTNNGLKVITQTLQLFNANNRQQISFSIQNIKKKDGTIKGCITQIFIPESYYFSFSNEK